MPYGQLPRYDHELETNFRSRRADEFVERGPCHAGSLCCSVVPSAVAIYLCSILSRILIVSMVRESTFTIIFHFSTYWISD